MASTIIANDTHHSGIEAALDLLHARREALSQMIDDAQKRHDIDRMLDLDVRHAEVCGLLSAMRALMGRAA